MSAGLILAGRYRLISKLGQGGMGSVWRAEDMNLGAEVAIKLIDAAFADSSEALKRFRREAQAAATIRSTYVVQILDHGIDNGTPFIAMELLHGESLAQRLESGGKLSVEQTGRILGHVGRALALAHEHGIVHRDMKPENVFLVREDDDDVGKVLDFGIARQSGGLSDSGGLKTQTGAILGTPYYMSPEQATGQGVDHLTDIWAFGVIASECLTGRRAFDSDSLGGLFHAICIKSMPVPSQLGEVPPGFDEWFARAAARDKAARFQSIKQATDELRALCRQARGRSVPAPALSQQIAGAATMAAAPTTGHLTGALQTTAAPASNTIQRLPTTSARKGVLIAIPMAALVVIGIVIGWRTLSRNNTTGSATAAIPSAATAAPAVSGAMQAVVAPSASLVPAPAVSLAPAPNTAIELVKPDAGVSLEAPASGRIQASKQAPVATPSRVAPQAARSISTPAKAAPAPEKSKPAPAGHPKRDDNAAGI
jgi:eukaryotic-like serine/threonine-protein kinase